MKTSAASSVLFLVAVSVALSGCAASAPEAEAPSSAAEAESPSPTPTSEPAVSDYPACPAGLTDTLNAASSGGNAWEEVSFEAATLPEGIGAPVPSCVLERGGLDWTQSFYVGGGQELFDTLAASIAGLGVPEYVSDYEFPGSKTWGTDSTGFATLTLITPGDQSTILGPAFTEPSLVLEINGTPIQ